MYISSEATQIHDRFSRVPHSVQYLQLPRTGPHGNLLTSIFGTVIPC